MVQPQNAICDTHTTVGTLIPTLEIASKHTTQNPPLQGGQRVYLGQSFYMAGRATS